jgi:hypothetical protein
MLRFASHQCARRYVKNTAFRLASAIIVSFALLTITSCRIQDVVEVELDSPFLEKYPDGIYQLSEFSVASLRSINPDGIDPPPKLNSWLISTVGSDLEIALKLHKKDPRSKFNDPALWALFIRTKVEPKGIMTFDTLEVKLFNRYTTNTDICCFNSLPLGSFDQAESSYVPVGGYVDFESERKGYFSLEMQRENELGSEDAVGAVVNIQGCWNIANSESLPSGCFR